MNRYNAIALVVCLLGTALVGCKATVPDVIGQPEETAKSMITGAKLKVGTVTEAPNDTYPVGQVFAQAPEGGAKVNRNTEVDLSVSTGPDEGEGEIQYGWASRALPAGMGDVMPMDISVPETGAGWIVGMEMLNEKSAGSLKGVLDEGEFDPFEGEGIFGEGEFDPFGGEGMFEEGEFPQEPVTITGFALRYLPAGWSKMALPDFGDNWSLFAVDAASASSAWLVGGDFSPTGLDFTFEGESAEGETGGEGESKDAAEGEGSYGAIALHDPGTGVLETVTNPGLTTLSAAAAKGPQDLWALNPVNALRYKDLAWTTQVLPAGIESVYALSFPTPEEGWVAGSGTNSATAKLRGFTAHLAAGVWAEIPLPALVEPWELLDIQALSSENVWAAGYSSDETAVTRTGVLLHYDGSAWQAAALPAVSTDWRLEALSFPTADAGWVCGTDHVNKTGIMLRLKEGVWQQEPMPAPAGNNWTLVGVSMSEALAGWAVGYDNQNEAMLLFEYGPE